MIQLLLADNHQLLHPGIQSILAPFSEITLIGTATNDIQLRQCCTQCQPDVLLLALNITEPPWTDILEYLQLKYPETKILILLHSPDEVCLHYLTELGTSGCILKSDAPEKLVEAIQSVNAGQKWFSPLLIPQLLNIQRSEQNNKLTEREREVLQMVAFGKTDKEVAQALKITKRTVRYHLQNANSKLGTTTRIEAVAEALRREIIQ